jgi:hypothetical protein
MTVDNRLHTTPLLPEVSPALRREANPASSAALPHTSSESHATGEAAQASKESSFTFRDFLDIINPLQHIPIVSTIYRKITGDEIKPATSIMGGTLFGGPIGMIASLADRLFEAGTGKDTTEFMLAAVTGNLKADNSTTLAEAQVAQAAIPLQEAPNALVSAATGTKNSIAQQGQYKLLTNYQTLPWLVEKAKQEQEVERGLRAADFIA